MVRDNEAPPCPHCDTENTSYGEYGVICQNNGFGSVESGCPIVFFNEH